VAGARRGLGRPLSTLSGIEAITISEPRDIAGAVVYLVEAEHVTGEVPHVDDGADLGKW
jgi:NAD(P)-dependent dehydrogenase (short-subunit alcohol dehydrogenase family)